MRAQSSPRAVSTRFPPTSAWSKFIWEDRREWPTTRKGEWRIASSKQIHAAAILPFATRHSPFADQRMLEVNAIDLHYGAAQALRAVSLKAEPGKVTCVLGRNGVGKTSLLDALAGQHPVTRGTVTLDGADITNLRPYEQIGRASCRERV